MSSAEVATRRPQRTFADLRKPGDAQEEHDKRQLFLNQLTAQVLDTPEGRRLVAHWRSITIDKRNPQESSESALREVEAQRRFVALEVEMRIQAHRDLTTKG